VVTGTVVGGGASAGAGAPVVTVVAAAPIVDVLDDVVAAVVDGAAVLVDATLSALVVDAADVASARVDSPDPHAASNQTSPQAPVMARKRMNETTPRQHPPKRCD